MARAAIEPLQGAFLVKLHQIGALLQHAQFDAPRTRSDLIKFGS
jgi:hypothetical protein